MRISKQPNKRTIAHIHPYTNKHLNDQITKVQLRLANTNTNSRGRVLAEGDVDPPRCLQHL